ncbi:MAG: sugar transferase [Planctomycetales bacterium]|nr:sugar transferase [Planctomycetales bacterium]
MTNTSFYRRFGKRLFDLAVTLPLALAFVPLIVMTALVIRLRMGTPVVFRQPRGGYGGSTFTLNKFRTMLDAYDKHGVALPDEKRLTTLGQILRKLSLDELPQLWNVIRGDMSLVGPRPLLAEYLTRYSAHQARRHEVLPGITGWAQVNGRNAIGWQEKFDLDVWYVDHVSFPLDLQILWKTAMRVIAPRDISASEHATMPKFLGNAESPETNAAADHKKPLT